jgi:hypothetical protein
MRFILGLVGFVVGIGSACGGSHEQPIDGAIVLRLDAAIDAPLDANIDAATTAGPCNVLAQTGCNAAEKCTWVEDATAPSPIGHVGCAPNTGGVAIGGTCAYGAPGPGGYDNCVRGSVCVGGRCKAICDGQGGAPLCPTSTACGIYQGLFDTGTGSVAGVCNATCNPLDDNDFDGVGTALTKIGTACATNQGCYGLPNDSPPTYFTCIAEVNPALQHRSPCTGGAGGDGCADVAGNPYLNGCAQGYTPFFRDQEGSTQWDCFAYCRPGNAYLNNPGTQLPNGVSPHACNTTDARGAFGSAADTTTNGEHCMYLWVFEYDMNGVHVPSPTSDTVGICVDHTKYVYDSNNNGTIDGADAHWPACSSLAVGPLVNGGYDATFFGCVDTATAAAAGTLFSGAWSLRGNGLRPPYRAAAIAR